MGELPHPRGRPEVGHPALDAFDLSSGENNSDTSPTVVGNLAAKLENLGGHVDAAMDPDGGHGASENAADFIQWIAKVTGHKS
ncbi:hypothetical protein ACF090_02420 [Streptomyces sp. NPDC014892]|uniref:hypothetical protein n=1 Tax=Streptomyces sp. NPDC014892 TaxID=3364930 RepID=UPI0036F7BEC6